MVKPTLGTISAFVPVATRSSVGCGRDGMEVFATPSFVESTLVTVIAKFRVMNFGGWHLSIHNLGASDTGAILSHVGLSGSVHTGREVEVLKPTKEARRSEKSPNESTNIVNVHVHVLVHLLCGC